MKVDDDFLLGLSEPGFQEVEKLDDATLLGEDLSGLIAQADAELAARKGKASECVHGLTTACSQAQ